MSFCHCSMVRHRPSFHRNTETLVDWSELRSQAWNPNRNLELARLKPSMGAGMTNITLRHCVAKYLENIGMMRCPRHRR